MAKVNSNKNGNEYITLDLGDKSSVNLNSLADAAPNGASVKAGGTPKQVVVAGNVRFLSPA